MPKGQYSGRISIFEKPPAKYVKIIDKKNNEIIDKGGFYGYKDASGMGRCIRIISSENSFYGGVDLYPTDEYRAITIKKLR